MGRPTVWNTQGELIHVVEEIPSWSQKIYVNIFIYNLISKSKIMENPELPKN